MTSQAREPVGVLRLVAHTTAAINRLIPLVAGFKRSHPKVGLDVTLNERPVDLVADGFDVGVVVPYMVTSETTVVRLLERIPMVIVAAPSYLDGFPAPDEPAQLVDHVFVPMAPSLRRPSATFKAGVNEWTIPLRYDVSSNNATFNREMVLEGFGIGLVPKHLVADALASGRLVRLLEEFDLVDGTVELLLAYSSRTLLPAKARAFIDHASGFFADHALPR
jgi:DNA-binding transcriptional LysR family regulator